MDLSAFKKSDWLKVGGAAGFFIFGFFSWVTVDVSVEGVGNSSDSVGNVFDFFWTGILPWLLVIATAVVTVLLVMKVLAPGQLPWPLIMLAANGLAALLLLIRLIFNPISGSSGFALGGVSVDYGRGIGMILSVLSGLVAFGGAFMGFKESGGDLNDLKDVDKLKSQFGMNSASASSTTPPPPPPPPPAAPPAPPAPPTAPPPPPPAP